MSKIIEFLKTRSVAYYIAIVSAICALVALITYLAAGTNQFAPELKTDVIIPLSIGLALGIFSMIKTFKLALLGEYLLYLYGFISVFIVNINLIANIIYNVDGSSFPASFIVIVIFSGIATFGALAAGIMTKFGQGSRKRDKEARA